MVSYDLAQENGWQVGDRIELSLYESDAFGAYNMNFTGTNNFRPVFPVEGSFFTTQTYEIVGLYDGPGLELTGAELKLERDENGKLIPPELSPYLMSHNVILLPEKSVQNAPQTRRSSFLTTTIRVENGTADQYLNDLESRGLLEPNADGVRVDMTFYDQGYYYADQLAESTGAAAKVIVALAASTALVSITLFSYLYVSRRRNEMAIMRALGISGRRIGLSLLLCLLLVTIIAVALGAGVGVWAVDLTESLLLKDQDARLMTLFSSTYGQDINKSETLSLSRSPLPFAAAAGGILLLVAAVTGGMLAIDLQSSPMGLLSGKRQ